MKLGIAASMTVFEFFRGNGGRLSLLPDVGKIALTDITLIDDPSESSNEEEDASMCSTRGSTMSVFECVNALNRSFKVMVDVSPQPGVRETHTIHLVASTVQEKAAWISDISQCLDNIWSTRLFATEMNEGSGGKSCRVYRVWL